MTSNLPPSITVDRNLAYSIRNYVKQNGGKNVSESQMNEILQRVAKFDSERDAGTREGGSIFDGGSKYLGGTGNDFRVKQGQVIQLSTEEFNKIFEGILNPLETKTEENPVAEPAAEAPELAEPSLTIPEVDIPETLEVPRGIQSEVTEGIIDAVDGKVLEREVDGKKQKISVATVNGEKVRRLINEDGSLGENLVLVSSAGKNKYITQSEMDKRIAKCFPNGLPEGVKAEFVNIGGSPELVFKKDGKILDNREIQELAAKANAGTSENVADGEAGDENVNFTKGEPLTGTTFSNTYVTNHPPVYYDEVQSPEVKPQASVQGKLTPEQLEEFLANDTTYQEYQSKLTDIDTRMAEIEQKYGMPKVRDNAKGRPQIGSSGFSAQFNIFGQPEQDEYSTLGLRYKTLNKMLEQYKTVMQDWTDGPTGENSVFKRNTETYTNLERITLKDGRRAWKTDQGIFLPAPDGMPGGKRIDE